MIDSDIIPTNWEVIKRGDEFAVLESEDRRKKIKISTITVQSHEDELPRIQGFKTENPYEQRYGDKCVDLILEPEKCVEDNVLEAIDELEQD